MQSRVRRGVGQRFAPPTGHCGITASVLSGQHQAGGAASLSGKLQAAACAQRQRFLGLSDDERNRGRAQGFLDAPQKIDLALGLMHAGL